MNAQIVDQSFGVPAGPAPGVVVPTIIETAEALSVSEATLRRWLRQGAPQARRGRRGRGGGTLLDVAAIRAWRGEAPAGAVLARVLACEMPDIVATAALQTFREIDGPHKRASAGALAAVWYAIACALRDRLAAVDASIPEIATLPAQICHLRAIYGNSATVEPRIP